MNNIQHFRARRITSKVLLRVVLIGSGLVMVLPFVWMIFSSFKPALEIISLDFQFFPKTWTLRNYLAVFEDMGIGRGYTNSFIVALAITFCVLFSATISGYMFSKLRFFGKEVLFFVVLASIMVPPQTMIIPLYLLINKFHWINTYQGLVFPFIFSAFGIFLMRQFINGIPNDLIDAAKIDGACEFRIYYSVILPLVRSSMSVLGILTFLWSWDTLLWPLIVVQGNEMKTLPLILSRFTSGQQQVPGEALATCTLIILPIIIVYLFFQRHFVKGMTMTGIKG